ncbi:hypothetical protein [Peribacillus glennii]|uniref:Uncharacterized protein n=1 Tax=Peribacillus glennii TaxID=2303991 RepID=A0A372LB57_9BACI|nr:hypothetical protein [Peribacillus glennii]RFU62986.1 hypothetical protein D0466_13670 [Peribacillus glennii]
MEKHYRISWYTFVENDELFEGRSLIKAEDEADAAQKLIMEKAYEYKLKPQLIRIYSLHELLRNE